MAFVWGLAISIVEQAAVVASEAAIKVISLVAGKDFSPLDRHLLASKNGIPSSNY